MESYSITPSKNVRFHFTVEKDIALLKEVLNCNPFEFGSEKWSEVARNLKEEKGFDLTIRTIKDRINNLLIKMQKDDLASRTSTEEICNERKSLLYEVKLLKCESVSEHRRCSSAGTSRRMKSIEANKEREHIFQEKYGGDSTSSETGFQRKRIKISEEDIVMKKIELEYAVKIKQMEYDQEYRIKALEVEKERIQLERENKEIMAKLLTVVNSLIGQNNK